MPIHKDIIDNNFIDDTQSPEQISGNEKTFWEQWKTKSWLFNIFDSWYMDIVKEAEKNQHINWELPSQLKEILSKFTPYHTTTTVETLAQDGKIPRKKKKNPPRFVKKTVLYSRALWHVLQQIGNDIGKRINTIENTYFAWTSQIQKETIELQRQEKQKRFAMLREFKDITGIPVSVFWNAPMHQLDEINQHVSMYKESVITMKNYVGDMMKWNIIPAFQNAQHWSYEEQNDAYNKLVTLTYIACFSHPVYKWNVHPHVLFEYVKNSGVITIKDFRGALAEAYGKYLLEHIHEYIDDAQFQCVPLATNNTTRRILDLHVKSDAVYKVQTADSTDMIWSVDFKNKWDRKEAWAIYDSLESNISTGTQVTPMYDREQYTHKVRRALRLSPNAAIPVKGIMLYVWLPKAFQDMNFTPSIIKADAEIFYSQLLQATQSQPSPTQ